MLINIICEDFRYFCSVNKENFQKELPFKH